MPSSEPPSQDQQPELWRVATVMATGIFATTFVQTQSLGYLPLNHLLTHTMRLDSDRAATFFSLAMAPWTFKAVAGLLVDGVPLFGSRRRAYLLLSALTALTMWLLMGLAPGNFPMLLGLAIGMNAAIVFGSTTAGGLLVEAGQRHGMSGRLSSLRVTAQNLGAGLVGPISGVLAARTIHGDRPLFWTAMAAVVPLSCMFLATWFLLKEPPLPARPERRHSFGAELARIARSIWDQIRNVLRRDLLFPALLVFFLQAVPTFRSTSFYQYQTGPLHYSDEQLGWLVLAGYGGSFLSSGVYVWWCRKASLRFSLYLAIVATSLSALPYLFYNSDMTRAVGIEVAGTFLQILAYLPLFDMMVRSTPKGSEALGYSVLISIWNVGLMIGGKTGPMLYERVLHKQMNGLIWINALVTLAAVAIVFLLPAKLVEKREGS